jgi:PAS domain S-box-containing protein
MQELLDRAVRIFHADVAGLLLLEEDGETLAMAAALGLPEEVWRSIQIPVGSGFAGKVFAARRPMRLEEVDGAYEVVPALRSMLRAGAGVPLLVGGRAIGVLNLGTSGPRRFSDEDIALLDRVAARIARAVDRARLQEAVSRRAQQQAAVAALGQRAIAGADFQALAEAAAATAARLLGTEYASILELLPGGRELLPRAAVGFAAELIPVTRISAGPETQSGYTLRSRAPVIVADLRTEARFRGAPILQDHGIISGMSVAIQGAEGGEQPFGILNIHSPRKKVFCRDDIHFLEALANILSDALRNQRAEEALRKERDFIAAVLDTVGALIIVLDREGRVVRFNRACEELTGYRFEEVRGRTIWELLITPEQREAVMAVFAQLRAGEQLSDHENDWVTRGGARRRVAWSNTMLLGRGGEVEFIIGTGIDVTATRKAEEQRGRLYQEAIEAVRLRDDFLSVASHELRTPLTPLELQISSVQRALRGDAAQLTPERLQDKTDIIARQVERLKRLVDELLDLSRITAGKLRLLHEEVDLAAAARDAALRFRESLARAGCELNLYAGRPVAGWWDRTRVDQILTNLLSNAIKYGAGTPIDLIVEGDEKRARLVVRDRGIGIAPEEQARIFGRFERAVSDRHYGGFGLGLWIVKQILDALGGTIRVDSAPGRGSTFIVELPRRAAESGVAAA